MTVQINSRCIELGRSINVAILLYKDVRTTNGVVLNNAVVMTVNIFGGASGVDNENLVFDVDVDILRWMLSCCMHD